MRNNTNILKGWKLLLAFLALFLLFSCTEKKSTALNDDVDVNQVELEHRECWQGGVLAIIYDTSGKLAMGMYGQITHGAMAFMMIAFAIWMAFRLMKHVGSFTEESPGEVWTEVIKKFFLCFVCGLLASSPAGSLFVLNDIIFPIYNAFLELGSHMMQLSGNEAMHWLKEDMFLNDPVNPPKYDLNCTFNPETQERDATLLGFPNGPKELMECMVCSVNERLNFGFKLGLQIMSEIGIMSFICGIIVFLSFLFVKLGFVFYLVDSVFRFAMMTMILPILIMGYPFKPTRKWTVMGFRTILNSGAFMMCIALVSVMAISASYQILATYAPIFDWNGVLTNGMRKSISDFSIPFMMLLLLSFLIVGTLGVAKSIADKLVGGGGETNVQKKIATKAAQVGKKLFTLITAGFGGLLMKTKLGRRVKGKLQGWKTSLVGNDDTDEDEDRS